MKRPFTAMAAAIAFAATFMAVPALAQKPPRGPAGTPICAECHEQSHASTAHTHHGARNDANGTMCQACHGDATAHLKDPEKNPMPRKFAKNVPAAEKDAVCMTCHAGNRHLAFWESGRHAKNEVSCSNCHNIHGKTGPASVTGFTTTTRALEADTCGTCHKQVRNATLKPSHHPIIEGKVTCSDCHNPHGALTPAMLKHESVNQQCYSCHADKRGPFVFSHPPVEENCLSCHTPHGSVHAKLLSEKAPNLCQDCHVTGRHPTAFYGAGQGWTRPDGTPNTGVSNRFVARSCLNCHNQVHGSNAPSNRGRYLIR